MRSWEWLYKERILPHVICRDGSRDRGGGLLQRPLEAPSFSSCQNGRPASLVLSPRADTHQLGHSAALQPSGMDARGPHTLEGHISPVCLLPQNKIKFLSLWVAREWHFPFTDISWLTPLSGELGHNIVIKLEMLQDAFLKSHVSKKL